MATTSTAEQPPVNGDAAPAPAPRKFKASDLPLPSATRAAIESLAHSFKKEGAYDSIRKQVWEKFEASDYEAQVTKAILEVAEQEIERNPHQLLTLDRRKAAALIDGALERSGVYQKAETVISQLIDVGAIEERIRETRRAEVGEEAAESEKVRGSKTDEEYAADTEARRAERERLREEIRQKEAAIEEEKRRIAREERKKEEREREKAELKRQEERDERRRKREKDREEQLEVDSSLAPPPRKSGPVSAINPIRRDRSRVTEGRKHSDAGLKTDRGGSRTPADTKRPEASDERKASRSVSRAVDRERDRDREKERDRDRPRERDSRRSDRRSNSPRRDRRLVHELAEMIASLEAGRDQNMTTTSEADPEDEREVGRVPDQIGESGEDEKQQPREKDRDRRSRSRSRAATSAVRPGSSRAQEDLEEWKMEEVRKREKEAKAYLAAQKDARDKGLPIPGLDDKRSSGDRSPDLLRRRRIMDDIDRYTPGARDEQRRRSTGVVAEGAAFALRALYNNRAGLETKRD
ncbi:hypothetical protein ACJZ2D_006245 [Fusarium nematophilum]